MADIKTKEELLEEELKVDKHSLLGQWRAKAYDEKANKGWLQKFWQSYFLVEKGIYEELLKNPEEKVEGTVAELAEKYGTSVENMVGFLDGINDSLVERNPIETMTEDTHVSLDFDNEKLYKNMVDAKADWLYELPEWDDIFSKEDQKKSNKEACNCGTCDECKKSNKQEDDE